MATSQNYSPDNSPSVVLAGYPCVKCKSIEDLLKFIFIQRLMERDQGVVTPASIQAAFDDSVELKSLSDKELLELLVAKYMGSINPASFPEFESDVVSVCCRNARELKAAIAMLEFQMIDNGDR